MSAPGGQELGGRSAPPPIVLAELRSFAYRPVGPSRTADDEPIDLAEELHEASKIRRDFPAASLGPGGAYLAGVADSAFTLGRRSLAHAGPMITLPAPASLPVDLCDVVSSRRSDLPDSCGTVGLGELATLLSLSAGSSAGQPGLRVTPSAGALYPIDLVIIAHRVDGLCAGAFVYDTLEHALVPRCRVSPGEFHRDAGGPLAPAQPSLTVALVATFARTRAKYGLRGYRFALIEAGHLAQAMILAATALGLHTLPWGGYIDDAVDDALDLDGIERSCVYLLAVSARPDPPEQHR